MSLLFNFVVDEAPDELEILRHVNPDVDSHKVVGGSREWCLQTYGILKRQSSLPVECADQMRPDAINIAHSAHLMRITGGPNEFIVSVQADFPKCPWAHAHIVQNQRQVGNNSHFVPFWIQPGLIPRNQSRDTVTTVAYAGQLFGNFAGDPDIWQRRFRRECIDFRTLAPGACSDLSDIDVLIGIRSFDYRSHDRKPASKLINAWAAGIPFIGGHDSAFKQVGRPGIDYLVAATPDEVVSAVSRLKDDPNLYRAIVERGRERCQEFSREKTAARWTELLSGPIQGRYLIWQRARIKERIRFASLVAFSRVKQNLKEIAKPLIGATR